MNSDAAASASVYHVEMRQFPHNMCRFNLSGEELRATVLDAWARERWVEFGERKWSPHQATLTVLEGPRIPFGQLTMGRGWRTAQRSGRDVTEELLAAAREEIEGVGEAPATAARGGSEGDEPRTGATMSAPAELRTGGELVEDLAADSLGLELLARIGGETVALRRVWEVAVERSPELPASATLALAERAVHSLLRAGLVELVVGGRSPVEASTEVHSQAAPTATTDGLLRAIASWGAEGGARGVSLRRV